MRSPASFDCGTERGPKRLSLNRIGKAITLNHSVSPIPDSPVYRPNQVSSSQSLAIAYAKVLEVMVSSPMSPACEDWRPMILSSRPRKPQVLDTPRYRRTAKSTNFAENSAHNFIGEVKEGQTFAIPLSNNV
jgi:hypothetical protein